MPLTGRPPLACVEYGRTKGMKWLLSALLGGVGLLYLYWALGGRWLADKASPIVEGRPLIELTWHRCLGAACGTFILAAVPVVRMLPLLREFLLLTIMPLLLQGHWAILSTPDSSSRGKT